MSQMQDVAPTLGRNLRIGALPTIGRALSCGGDQLCYSL